MLIKPVSHLWFTIIEFFKSLLNIITESAEQEHNQGKGKEQKSSDRIHVLVLGEPEVLVGLDNKIEHYEDAQDEDPALDVTKS
jgi:hypothetical protein